eukprot:3350520-Amphidinium_carterae.1
MDECTKSVTVIQLNDIQDKYTADEVRKLNNTYPNPVTEGEDGYDDFMDITVNIKMMRGDRDVVSFSQTLNYVLLHATTLTRRVMRQSYGFESWRQLQLHFAGGHRAQQFSFLRAIMQPSWNSDSAATLDSSPSSTTSVVIQQPQGQHCAEPDDEDQSQAATFDDVRVKS